MKKFSKLRVKQLWDKCRIFSAWYSSIKHGRRIYDKKTGRRITLQDCINRYAHARGLLLALGYKVKHGFKPKKKTTLEFRELFKKAWPKVKKWYLYYRNKVKRS